MIFTNFSKKEWTNHTKSKNSAPLSYFGAVLVLVNDKSSWELFSDQYLNFVCLPYLMDENVPCQTKSQHLLGKHFEACLDTMLYTLYNLFHSVLEPAQSYTVYHSLLVQMSTKFTQKKTLQIQHRVSAYSLLTFNIT